MTLLTSTRGWLADHKSVYLDLVRIYLGMALFALGIHFINNANEILTLLQGTTLQPGNIILVHFVSLTHLIGGLLLSLGLLTRLAAAIQLPNLFGAVFIIHIREGLFGPGGNLELALLVLVLLIVFTVNGGGRWSVDRFMLEQSPD